MAADDSGQGPMILVIGQPRTGTSLAMQMLAAAGINCLGVAPAYEDDRALMLPVDFSGLGDADALKIVWHSPVRIPANACCIVTTRKRDDQIDSEWKFTNAMILDRYPVPAMDRGYRNRARHMHRTCESEIANAVCRRDHMSLRFDDVLAKPMTAAERIIALIGQGDPSTVAAVVVDRDPGNYPGFMESQLIEAAPAC